MKKGIIFDMDGTLWDSAAEVAESWNETVKRAGYDRKPITVKDIQSVMGKKANARNFWHSVGKKKMIISGYTEQLSTRISAGQWNS